MPPSQTERQIPDLPDLQPGDEIELYVFLNNDVGYDWEPAIVLEVDPLRIRWADGSGEQDWTRPGARVPGIRMKAPTRIEYPETTSIVLYVAHCARCNTTVDADGGEYQSTVAEAVALALGEYGGFERRDGKLVCPDCCLAEDEPDV